jgi:metal-responsive CopG/Arc/MetJ family transcriptional regulator
MRTLIDLADPQIAALAEISRQEGASRAALVREAVDDLIAKRRRQRGPDAAFGLWKGAVPSADGLAMQAQLRAEWDDR